MNPAYFLNDSPASTSVSTPVQFVLFGARGDLAGRFLWPALFGLFCTGHLPRIRFVAVDVPRIDRARFHHWLGKHLNAEGDSRVSSFLQLVDYLSADVKSEADFEQLALTLRSRMNEFEGNFLFYLAVPPALYDAIIERVAKSGLVHRSDNSTQKIVFEKPFGHDAQSAKELDENARRVFPREWIYRMDHYQGKGMVQFLFSLRRLNPMFEALLSPKYIDHIQISAVEEVGVEGRAGYYDQNGVIRDMLQNHLLELFMILGMQMPTAVTPDNLEAAQMSFLDTLPQLTPSTIRHMSCAAQYSAGGKICGYLDSPGVNSKSTTPTYSVLKLVPQSGDWKGKSFFLRSGKALRKKVTQIVVVYSLPDWMSTKHTDPLPVLVNRLIITIDPKPMIRMRINGRVDGPRGTIDEGEFSLDYSSQFGAPELLKPYELLLLRVLAGTRVPFKSGRVLTRCWEVVDPVVRHYEKFRGRLPQYEAGSWGPDAADQLLGKKRTWVN